MKKYLFVVLLALVLWLIVPQESASVEVPYVPQETPGTPEIPEIPLTDRPLNEIVEHFALEYGSDPKTLLAVMRCESGGRQSAVGDGNRAIGIYQFHRGTFTRMAKAKGESLDINSSFDQAKLATWAFANGYGREWTSYRAIQNGGTYVFYSKLLEKWFTVRCSLK